MGHQAVTPDYYIGYGTPGCGTLQGMGHQAVTQGSKIGLWDTWLWHTAGYGTPGCEAEGGEADRDQC